MVNSERFIERLEYLLDYFTLSASSFADKVGVQRSSLSHLLSGRNKPSLDFIMKVIETFPEVDLYWLLNGKGTFPKQENVSPQPYSPTQLSSNEKNAQAYNEKRKEFNGEDYSLDDKEIEKIAIFYKDGTFKIYSPG